MASNVDPSANPPLLSSPASAQATADEAIAAAAESQYGPYTGAVAPRPSRSYQLTLLLATIGGVVSVYAPVSVALSLKVSQLQDADARVGGLSAVLAVGAIFALITNPLIGRMSDATKWKFGRRRPYLIGGAVITLIGLVTIALGTSLLPVIVGWAIVQIGCNSVLAASYATLVDQVAPQHRGKIGGILGIAVPSGMALGAWMSSFFNDVGLMLIVPGAIGSVPIIIFALVLRDRPARADVPGINFTGFFGSFVFNPRKYPDFGWVWLTRFLFMAAYNCGTLYSAFFLITVLHLPIAQVGGTMALVLIASGLGNFITSPLGGWLSDKFGRRKLFVAIAAVVAMAGLVTMAFSTNVPQLIVAQFILGLGLGCFTAVDLALASDTLPADGKAAKNLGVFNIANALPQSIVPIFAAPLIGIWGYQGLFIVGAILGLIGAALVYRVKSVR